MHVYSKPLDSVTVRSSSMSGFTKIGMDIATPANSFAASLGHTGIWDTLL